MQTLPTSGEDQEHGRHPLNGLPVTCPPTAPPPSQEVHFSAGPIRGSPGSLFRLSLTCSGPCPLGHQMYLTLPASPAAGLYGLETLRPPRPTRT